MSGPMAANAAKTLCDVFYLAMVVWREARGASNAAQIAVASSVMNRVKHPGWWGDSVDAVATKKWQYSSMTDPNDKQLSRWPVVSDPSWLSCLGVAYDVLHGGEPSLLPGADSYYDDSILAPKWATEDKFVGKIDNINFYDTDHDHEAEALVGAALTSGLTQFDLQLAAFIAGARKP